MYNIKHGYGCGIKATLLTASGEVCDLRRARYKGAVLVLPNGSTIPCADVSVDDITNTMYVRLLGDRELTTIGRYGILFNVKLANGVMYSSPIVMFADVQDDAEMEYRELNISIAVTVTYLPANVAYTGASPKISPNGTWLVYNDELNAYEDTGEPASYAGLAGNIQELHEQIEERTTTTYITEAVDVDWKTVGKNAEGKLCVIGGDTQVADFIEGYLLANGYAKLSELAKIFASIEWVEEKKYITDADIPSLVSAFTNDKGYITLDAIAPYAKKATTLGGYGITNAYTKEETESRFFAFTKIDNETIKRNEDGFMYVDFSNVPTSIFDGLPIDNETIYWDNGVLKAMGGGGGGGVADSVAWANVTGKPKWLQDAGNAKPTYTASEVGALASGATAVDSSKLGGLVAARFLKGTGVIESADFNEQNVIGLYRYNSVTDKNSPADGTSYGNLLVLRSGGCDTLTQMYFNSSAKMQIFVRSGSTSNFTSRAWKQIAFTSDIPSLAGYATETFVNTALAGYLPLSGGTVNGNITAAKYYGEEISTKLASNNRRSYITNTGFSIVGTTTANWASGLSIRDADGNAMTTLIGAYGEANFTPSYIYIGGSRTAPIVKLDVTTNDVIFNGTAYTQKFRAIANSSTNPTLGAMGSADFGMVVASGTTSTYGLYGWITGSGDSHLQTGREDGNTTPYNLIFQELGGKVGIGTDAPESKLHVNGNTQITGNLIFDSSHQTLISRKLNSTGETVIFTQVNSDDNLLIGQGIAKAGKNTYIYGKEIDFCYGTAGSTSSTAMHIYSNGDVAMSRIYLYPQTQNLNASSGVLRFHSDSTLLSGPSIQGVHAQMGYGAKHLVFYQHNTGGYTEYEAMRLTYDGNLVIGGSTAEAKLHVYGNIKTSGFVIADTRMYSYGYLMTNTGLSYCGLVQNSLVSSVGDSRDIWLYNEYMTNICGRTGVSIDGASAGVTIKGNLLTTGGITMYSQRSLKNILSYDGLSLEQLSVIKPIKFTWKDGRDNRYHVGGIADDMATVVPEVVYSTNDFLTMDYGNAGFYVAASLIKPVVNHEQRIKILERENKALRDEINQLKQAS